MTAQAVHAAHSKPAPQVHTSVLLREQCFGVAEGRPWKSGQPVTGLTPAEHVQRGIYPGMRTRAEKFPDGESLDDLAKRAERAVQKYLLPHVWAAARNGTRDTHIAIVSHGLCISEVVAALVRLDSASGGKAGPYKRLTNTGWARVIVGIPGAIEGLRLEFPDNDPPPIRVSVVEFNRHEHVEKLKRIKALDKAAADPKQQDLRTFFGGGGLAKVEVKEEVRA